MPKVKLIPSIIGEKRNKELMSKKSWVFLTLFFIGLMCVREVQHALERKIEQQEEVKYDNSMDGVLDRFASAENRAKQIEYEEKALGIHFNQLRTMKQSEYPEYYQRQNVILSMYYQVPSRRPMSPEIKETIIRASFEVVPLSATEYYTINEVVAASVVEGRHLSPMIMSDLMLDNTKENVEAP